MITSLIHNTNNVIDDIPSIRRSNQLLQLQGEQNKQQKTFKNSSSSLRWYKVFGFVLFLVFLPCEVRGPVCKRPWCRWNVRGREKVPALVQAPPLRLADQSWTRRDCVIRWWRHPASPPSAWWPAKKKKNKTKKNGVPEWKWMNERGNKWSNRRLQLTGPQPKRNNNRRSISTTSFTLVHHAHWRRHADMQTRMQINFFFRRSGKGSRERGSRT